MIGNLADTAILLLVIILLLAGEKNVSETIRNVGKFYQELRRRQIEFTSELRRELASLNEIRPDEVSHEVRNVSHEMRSELVRQVSFNSPVYQRYNDKIAQLESEIKRLKAELERLKQDGNKN